MKNKSCNKIDNTCGKKINARCVDYEGEINDCSSLEDKDCLSIHETTEDIYKQIEDLKECLDLSSLGKNCLEYGEECEDLKINKVLLKLEEKVCELCEAIPTPQSDPNYCNPIFEQDLSCLELDYKCLTDPCNNEIKTLKQLLQALIDKNCECCDSGNTN